MQIIVSRHSGNETMNRQEHDSTLVARAYEFCYATIDYDF